MNLQLFGGRGSGSGMNSGSSNTASTVSPSVESRVRNLSTKFTNSQISSMSRSQLETVARAVYAKNNPGLSAAEADRRARMLMDGNTTAQLRKYIKKHG